MNIAWFSNNLYLTKEVEKKKTTNIINTHSLIQSSCSTCCYCITLIIQSAYVYTQQRIIILQCTLYYTEYRAKSLSLQK